MISIYLTILVGLLILRVFFQAIAMIGGKKSKLSDRERLFIGIFWLIASIGASIMYLQEMIFT